MPTPVAELRSAVPRLVRRRLEAALRRARQSGGGVLASATTSLPAGSDPSALVIAARAPDEPWFCLEQPERDATALAALGCALELRAAGPNRFRELARRWREASGAAVADPVDGPPGSGLVALGGFAFAPDGGQAPHWDGFPAASLHVPELAIARRGAEVALTVTVQVLPDDTLEDLELRLSQRLGGLRAIPLPLLDPSPTGAYRVTSPMPPAHYEEAVARGIERIRSGELEKIVLAREVDVLAPRAHDPAAVFGVLRDAYPSCFVFAVGRGSATFLAASPELLIRREGQRASTVALAGSTRRSADPAVDDHLGEQLRQSAKDREENAIVARRIARALRPHAVWVTAAEELLLVRVAGIQHLARPIRAQLAEPLDAVELAGLLHPTPAVGGEPGARAAELIPALEGFDRGWYAGTVGWTDLSGDGEFCVGLRCALVRDRLARLYAGCGIVRDSDPAAELSESEIKLGALLPVLSG